MNWIKHNFWLIIENLQAQIRLDRANRKTRKAIRKHGKELAEAKRQADLMHEATKKTYWVLPDYNGVLQVLDKSNLRNLKRAKIMNKEVTIVDLLMESEYNTMDNHFVVLKEWGNTMRGYEYFRGTVLECIEKYKDMMCDIQILGGFERVVTIKDGKVIMH